MTVPIIFEVFLPCMIYEYIERHEHKDNIE